MENKILELSKELLYQLTGERVEEIQCTDLDIVLMFMNKAINYAHSSTLLNACFKIGDNVVLDNGLKAEVLGFKNNLAIVLDEKGLKLYKQLNRIKHQ